jgi:hypothetical protein
VGFAVLQLTHIESRRMHKGGFMLASSSDRMILETI